MILVPERIELLRKNKRMALFCYLYVDSYRNNDSEINAIIYCI